MPPMATAKHMAYCSCVEMIANSIIAMLNANAIAMPSPACLRTEAAVSARSDSITKRSTSRIPE